MRLPLAAYRVGDCVLQVLALWMGQSSEWETQNASQVMLFNEDDVLAVFVEHVQVQHTSIYTALSVGAVAALGVQSGL